MSLQFFGSRRGVPPSAIQLRELQCSLEHEREKSSTLRRQITKLREELYETKAECEWFVIAAATLWKALPINIQTSASLATFKARLKTHFFDCSRGLVLCFCTFIDILFNLFIYLLYIYTFIQLK